jgi:hypothetical protein
MTRPGSHGFGPSLTARPFAGQPRSRCRRPRPVYPRARRLSRPFKSTEGSFAEAVSSSLDILRTAASTIWLSVALLPFSSSESHAPCSAVSARREAFWRALSSLLVFPWMSSRPAQDWRPDPASRSLVAQARFCCCPLPQANASSRLVL